MTRVYALGCLLLSVFGFWACKIDCTKLPDNRPKEILAIPVRVAEPCNCTCESQNAFIEVLQQRMRYCEELGF